MRTVEGQFEALSAAVDRLFDMDTYNGVSLITWDVSFSIIVNDIIPRDKVGIGLGCWIDDTNNGEKEQAVVGFLVCFNPILPSPYKPNMMALMAH